MHSKQHLQMVYKIGFLKNLSKFLGKHLYQNLAFNYVVGWEISQNSQENICASVSFLIKLQAGKKNPKKKLKTKRGKDLRELLPREIDFVPKFTSRANVFVLKICFFEVPRISFFIAWILKRICKLSFFTYHARETR